MPPQSQSFALNNFRFHCGQSLPEISLYCTTWGTPTGHPVLLLHGTNGSAAGLVTTEWHQTLFGPGQPLDLAQHWVIAPDALGCGRRPGSRAGPALPPPPPPTQADSPPAVRPISTKRRVSSIDQTPHTTCGNSSRPLPKGKPGLGKAIPDRGLRRALCRDRAALSRRITPVNRNRWGSPAPSLTRHVQGPADNRPNLPGMRAVAGHAARDA